MSNEMLQRIVDIEDIKQLKARYYRFNDTQDWEAFRTVFGPEATYDSGNHVLRGADKIATTFGDGLEGGRTAHMAGLPEITLTGPDTASGIWAFRDYVDVAREGKGVGFFGYGHEDDEYVRTADGWRISSVRITRLRIDPLEGGLPAAFNQAAEGAPARHEAAQASNRR